MLYTTSFYNFKISTSNKLTSLFKKNDFSFKTRLFSIKRIYFQDPYKIFIP